MITDDIHCLFWVVNGVVLNVELRSKIDVLCELQYVHCINALLFCIDFSITNQCMLICVDFSYAYDH